MTCEPRWMRASSQATSFPFIQIFSEVGKDIREDPPRCAGPTAVRAAWQDCARRTTTPNSRLPRQAVSMVKYLKAGKLRVLSEARARAGPGTEVSGPVRRARRRNGHCRSRAGRVAGG